MKTDPYGAWREEPSGGALGEEVGRAAAAASCISARFEVRAAVDTRPSVDRGGLSGVRRFPARGEIRFEGETVFLVAEERRFIQSNSHIALRAPMTDIFNVRADGRVVSYEICPPEESSQRITVLARSHSEALSIVSRLPKQTTAACASEQAETACFEQQLAERAPHALATWGIIAANVLVFVAMTRSGAGFDKLNPGVVLRWGANYGPETLNGQWWRLLTACFIHFGFVHLAFNMAVLGQMGRIAERLFGSGRFLAVYLFAGIAGSMLSVAWHPLMNSAGASGAVFGVFGGLLAFLARHRGSLPRSAVAGWRQTALTLVVYNLFSGFVHTGVDNAAHLGGLVGGLAMGWALARPFGKREASLQPTVLVAWVVVIALGGMLGYRLLHVSEGTRQELRFASALRQFAPAEREALNAMKSLGRIVATPGGEALAASRLRNDVAPRWERLYRTLDAAPLPPSSPRVPLRAALLRYLYDRWQSCLLLADLNERHSLADPAAKARLKSLIADENRQAALFKSLLPTMAK